VRYRSKYVSIDVDRALTDAAPNTWLEVFFLADGHWQGPVGLSHSLWTSFRRKIRLSSTFAMFSAIVLLSLAQPLLISRAYPYTVKTTNDASFLTPPTYWFDVNDHLATGLAAWRLGPNNEGRFGLFSGSFYVDNNTGESNVFVASQQTSGTPPALWFNGSCTAVPLSDVPDLLVSATASEFDIWCSEHGLKASGARPLAFAEGPLSFDMRWCSDLELSSWRPNGRKGSTSVVAWLNATAPSMYSFLDPNQTMHVEHPVHVEGLINCTYQFAGGLATLCPSRPREPYDPPALFSDFKASPASRQLFSSRFLPPVYAAFASISLAQGQASELMTIPRLFFSPWMTGNHGNVTGYYLYRSLPGMATNLETGVRAMHATLATLISPNNGLLYTPVRVRNTVFFNGAVLVLAVWLALLAVCSWRMFSRTFSSSFNSYVAARLLFRELTFIKSCLYLFT
jgi:hypothetical protein